MQPFSDLTATDLKYNGITVYQTSWKGVGIAMSLNDKPGLIEFYGPRETPVGYIPGANFKHYLIKTGDIQPAPCPRLRLSFQLYLLKSLKCREIGHVYYPAVNIAVEGCRLNTPSKQVILDKVNRRVFRSRQRGREYPFNIALSVMPTQKLIWKYAGKRLMAFIKSWRLPSKESATGVGLQILHNGVPLNWLRGQRIKRNINRDK
ncbi:hypothetical protein J4732_12200 [Serratia marcescens]|uniref:Uncharacterized protein n=1 Tax=Serratia marcescens TaxID=615 RepID=A0A939NL17_SERMA|nr:hypothetical protein [Serratia marcescens]